MLSPFPSAALAAPFLSDIPLPGPFQIKPSHSTASLTMKKGGFSFSVAGGPTPRDDSARSDRKENALPGFKVPPLSPTEPTQAGPVRRNEPGLDPAGGSSAQTQCKKD